MLSPSFLHLEEDLSSDAGGFFLPETRTPACLSTPDTCPIRPLTKVDNNPYKCVLRRPLHVPHPIPIRVETNLLLILFDGNSVPSSTNVENKS